MPIILICPVCHDPFPCSPGRAKKWRQNFCSVKCRVIVVHRKSYAKPFDERFWAKVNKDTCLGETCGCHKDLGHCWPWMGSRSKRGYGRVYADGKLVQAHRVASTLTDPLMRPPEIHSLHHCDNPCCCRPDHVFHGTHSDNMRDREKKGRHILTYRILATHPLSRRNKIISSDVSLEDIRQLRLAIAERKLARRESRNTQ